ncbi:MAG: hypothetical protein OEZ05_04725 [Nitrospirota bacterium]|nr:hypothetical protein [Nitrospirota bacterium]MDH5585914.1 hypothetical protein [Nitrospirota bacterium]
MTVASSQMQVFPFTPSDGFILALDGLCNRAWGGCLSATTEIEIEGEPDREKLKWLAQEIPRRFPFLGAVLHGGGVFQSARWHLRADSPSVPLPLEFHRFEDVPGDEAVVASARALRLSLLKLRLHENGRPPHLRLDVVRHQRGRWLLLITWSHLLLDAVGIELFVCAIARLWDDADAVMPNHHALQLKVSAWQRFQDSEASREYLFHLSRKHFPSASRGRYAKGDPVHLVETFSDEESRRFGEVLKSVGGDLMAVFFHAVLAARAHRALLHARGVKNASIMLLVPAQLRPKTDAGDPVIFQNNMTMLHYVLENDELDNMSSACHLLMRQNVEHLRRKHHLSFSALLSLTRRIPSRLLLRLIRWQNRGELASLFHSWTGTFAQGIDHAFGGRVLNGYHIPSVPAPAGSGLFFSDCQGRISIVLSWVNSCVSAEEVAIMRKQWRHDLLGEPVS